jgi:magnesium-transporting ATPase (P-type)
MHARLRCLVCPGDNIHTAQHISRECGIMTEDAIALEGPVFRNMPANELIPLLPKLRVRHGRLVEMSDAKPAPCHESHESRH